MFPLRRSPGGSWVAPRRSFSTRPSGRTVLRRKHQLQSECLLHAGCGWGAARGPAPDNHFSPPQWTILSFHATGAALCGQRLGRDLLLAHQHLLKVGDLLARLGERPPRRGGDAEALYAEVQGLLARTSELTARSDLLLARQR